MNKPGFNTRNEALEFAKRTCRNLEFIEDAARRQREGWPTWTITRDSDKKPTEKLADLLRHVRNSVAHGRLTFTSDSRSVEEVAIIVEDKKRPTDPEPYWSARIEAKDLRSFCLRFLNFIDETIG